MSIFGFFMRFTIIYMLVMAATGIVMGILEVGNASNLNTPILLGISYWCFYSYTNKNSRIIEGNEKWKLIFLALAGDAFVSILLVTPTLIAADVPIKYMYIGLAVIIPFHLLLLMAVNYGVKKQILKQRPELSHG